MPSFFDLAIQKKFDEQRHAEQWAAGMAGLGRRTHYRKHLTDAVLFDLPEPNAAMNERIAKVVATRGSNQFDVKLATRCSAAENDGCVSGGGETVLAILPTKFRKLIWLKRNDFVILRHAVEDHTAGGHDEHDGNGNGNENDEDTKNVSHDSGGIRFMITHILYKDQILHLQSKQLWPSHDLAFFYANQADAAQGDEQNVGDGIVYQDESDSDGEQDSHQVDPLFVNTNRIANIALEDSSSDEDDED